jgi:hypothetical protein
MGGTTNKIDFEVDVDSLSPGGTASGGVGEMKAHTAPTPPGAQNAKPSSRSSGKKGWMD